MTNYLVKQSPITRAARAMLSLLAVMAWLHARGLPENKLHCKPLGSFEEWADNVAGAVSWLTGKNPIDLIEERKEQDPYAADERRVIAALVEHYCDKEWTAKDAAKDIIGDVWASAIRFKGEQPTANDVSYWLRKRKDRVFSCPGTGDTINHWTLGNELDRKGVARWAFRRLPGIAGDTSAAAAGHPGRFSEGSSRRRLDPSWDFLDEWRSRLNRTASLEARRDVAVAWVQSVPGAWVNGRSFKLPHDLPPGLALTEMRDFVKRCGFTEVRF